VENDLDVFQFQTLHHPPSVLPAIQEEGVSEQEEEVAVVVLAEEEVVAAEEIHPPPPAHRVLIHL